MSHKRLKVSNFSVIKFIFLVKIETSVERRRSVDVFEEHKETSTFADARENIIVENRRCCFYNQILQQLQI